SCKTTRTASNTATLLLPICACHRKPTGTSNIAGNSHRIPRAGLAMLPTSPTHNGVVHPSFPYPRSRGEPYLAQLTSSVIPIPTTHPAPARAIPHLCPEVHLLHCKEGAISSNVTTLISSPS